MWNLLVKKMLQEFDSAVEGALARNATMEADEQAAAQESAAIRFNHVRGQVEIAPVPGIVGPMN